MNQLSTFPKEISFDDEHFTILWKDGVLSQFSLLELRKNCPCATCRGGHGGKVGAQTQSIEKIHLISWSKVGRYAVSILWSDYHNTGIYSFDHLRAFGDGDKHAFD